jgi:flagellar biosynthetic protein FliP
MKKYITIAFSVFLLLAPAVFSAEAEGPEPTTANSLPSMSELMNVVDKATTDPATQEAAEWSTPIRLVVMFTMLALLPSILAMTTSFTRIAVVLGFVRRALGTQNIPPNTTILGLALFLTLYTMAPTLYKIKTDAIDPYLGEQIQFNTAAERASDAVKGFMIRQTRKSDLALFVQMAKVPVPEQVTDLGLHIVTPAFIISEFRTSFEIGCLIFIPFLLLDLVIAGVLLSAGMMMLPPVMISLPFKLILFILVDGWSVLAQGLSLSFK